MPDEPLVLDPAHHWLVPFAAPLEGEDPPALPALDALLALLREVARDADDGLSLSPPHERALARAQGLPLRDGALPWAALASDTPHTPQAWVHPVHLQVGTGQVTLQTAEQAGGLDEAESRALFDALAPLCTEDGIELRFDGPTRWLARGERLGALACASLDRVSGRSLATWLPQGEQARWLQRLQSEAQMLFYTHRVNDVREAARRLPINGVWFSAPGAVDGGTRLRPAPTVSDRLRAAALAGDAEGWRRAFSALDQSLFTPLLERARRGQPLALTLCGERAALTLVAERPGLAQRFTRALGLRSRARAQDLLKTL
ncbi:MAG: hypothetical protein GTN84_05015 [Hydrogenophaga sp.]|uniref:hypothetical protein n=1 Tax=Hydrogenophaga sp. TaxID=1904254 RepID=UPI0016A41BC4|nr:hypothetical protein [Hydrogenophaga sp.]NIM42738.1 hypothetical protein [Hydrogenophaga sp.]NIN25781.1 hypothetical protein [Hydrogenophaga sp.]NIN30443.1 hypothetical protein [Hydrogenophaga sp.]NIN56783.1 hypothetical protein [Hydrogenophaga sp.]NIO53358.1 hypothetical protein [Hydrogenophaga sp.]